MKAVQVVVILSLAGTALAHSGATGVVKERMEAMEALGKAMKALKAAVPERDAPVIAGNGAIIATHAGTRMTGLFPEGSLQHPSEARPEIWTDPARFTALADRLKRLGTALAKSAGQAGNEEPLPIGRDLPSDEALAGYGDEVLFQAVIDTCAACHKAYRIKN